MKINRTWLLLGVALIAAFLLYHFFRQPSAVAENKSNKASDAGLPASESATATNALNANPTTQTIASPPMNPSSTVNDRQKTNAILQYMESQNKPIEFYGQVVDQDGNPISGVKIKVKVRHWDVKVPAPFGDEVRMIPVEKATDLGGRFEIHDVTGDVFDIESIQKNGYALSPKTPNGFGFRGGSFEQPVIIRMWKLGKPAKLVTHRTLFGFQSDGRIYTLDLLTDKKIESGNANGDLRIQFYRQSIKPKETYPWTLEISAIDGGLVETADEFEYIAPENGYQPQVTFQMNSISPTAMPDLIKDYYFTSRNGQISGVVHLQIFSDYNGQSAILVESRLNPSGSRNLQP